VSDDSGLAVATLADTPEQLDRLFLDKPEYWELAAFASLLVQGRSKRERSIDAHRDGYAPYSGRQIETVEELDAYYCEVVLKLLELVRNLARESSAPLRRLFADRDLYDDEPTRREVTAAATLFTDFYRAILLLAREVRGVDTPGDYAEVMDNLALLVGFHLDGVDDFITRVVGFITVLPTLARNNPGSREYHSLGLELDPDYALMNRIKRQIKYLRQPWRRWLRPIGIG
jgi:hypothetical protein